MHVEIEHLDKPGFMYARGHWVRVRITLTPEEEAAVRSQRLWSKALFKPPMPDGDAEWYSENEWYEKLTISEFCSAKGFLHIFGSAVEAQNFAYSLRPHLENFKAVLQASDGPRNESFDL